jgi:hypothetical protein
MKTNGIQSESDQTLCQRPKTDAAVAVGCDDGLGACAEYIKTKIAEVEKEVKFRDDSYKTWREGTDASWRAAGCHDSKAVRLDQSDRHGRITIKCRRELQILQAVLENLQKRTVGSADTSIAPNKQIT